MGDKQFGKYLITEKLGSGGMAAAFRAELAAAEGVKKRLVLKVIHPHLAEKKSFVEMFIAEAKIVAGLTHGNIAQVFDFGKVDGQYFIAMEEVVGKPLSKVLKAAREAGYARLPVPLALQIVIGVLDGLFHAHSRKNDRGEPLNLVHRDATPDNVLISFEGEIKVVDFGIAKTAESADRTEMGSVRGKYPYMSPEQAGGKRDLDLRTDLWAVGVMLFEMLAGRRPFEGEWQTVMRDVISPDPVPKLRTLVPHLDPSLEAIVMAALEKDREKRPATARDFSHALTSYLHQHHPHATRQQLQFLLALLFPQDVVREGADITVPPNFSVELQRATSGEDGEGKPGPPVASHPPTAVPVPTREHKAVVDDGESTVAGLPGDDDEATVAGLPQKSGKPAETLAEILAAVRPGGIRPPTSSKELAVTIDEPKKKITSAAVRKPTASQGTPRVSAPRPTQVSAEVSLKKDMGSMPRRQSIAVTVVSLIVGVSALVALVMWRSAKESEVQAASTPPSVWITSSPPGANFSIDGAAIGRTPFSANVAPGEHTVVMELVGYAGLSRTFKVQAGDNLTVTGNLEFVGTTSADGGLVAEVFPDRPEPAWPAANDPAHFTKYTKRFHTLNLAKMAMPLNQYKPLKIELNPRASYQISADGAVNLGRGRVTSTLIYFVDTEGRAPGDMGLLGATPKTVHNAKSIRIFALDENLNDNAGQMSIEVRLSNYVPPQSYAFDARKHVIVPKPEHQFRIEGMDPKQQYYIFSRLDYPKLNKNWQGMASKLLCISHSSKAQPLAAAAHFITLGSHVVLEGSAGLSCFFLDDLTEDNSGSVELDIVSGEKVGEEAINPKLYTPYGKW